MPSFAGGLSRPRLPISSRFTTPSYIFLNSGLNDGNQGWNPLVGVVVGIDAGIVGGEVPHLVEAMLDRIGVGLVAEMPLAGEVRRIAVFLEELGDRRRFLPQTVLIARSNHDRER